MSNFTSLCSRVLIYKVYLTLVLPLLTCLVAQTIKRLPAMQETRVRFLGRESLEKSHGQRSLEGYSPWGRKESDTTE